MRGSVKSQAARVFPLHQSLYQSRKINQDSINQDSVDQSDANQRAANQPATTQQTSNAQGKNTGGAYHVHWASVRRSPPPEPFCAPYPYSEAYLSGLAWLAVFCGINAIAIFVHIFGFIPEFTRLQALTPIYAFLALGLSAVLLIAIVLPLLPVCCYREPLRQRQWIFPLALSAITLLVTMALGVFEDLAAFASGKNPEVILLASLGLYVWVACIARLEIKIQNRFLLGFAHVPDHVFTVNPLTRSDASFAEMLRYHVLKKREQVVEGDLLIVRAGDFLPLDGQIERGQIEVLVGPSQHQAISRQLCAGDFAFFGMKVREGEALVRVQRPAQESQMFRYLQRLYAQADAMQIEDQAQDFWERSIPRFLPFFFFASCAIIWLLRSEGSYADSLLRFLSVFVPSICMGLLGYLYFWKKIFPVDVFALGASIESWPVGMWKSRARTLLTVYSSRDTERLVPRQLEILDNRVDRGMLRTLVLSLLHSSATEDGAILRDFFDGLELDEEELQGTHKSLILDVRLFDEGDEFFEGEIDGERIALASEDWMVAHLRQFSPSDVGSESSSQRWCYISFGTHIIARILFAEADPSEVRSAYARLKQKGIRVLLLGKQSDSERLHARARLLQLPLLDIRVLEDSGNMEDAAQLAPYAFFNARSEEGSPLFEKLRRSARIVFQHGENQQRIAAEQEVQASQAAVQARLQFFGEHRENAAARIVSRFSGVCRLLAIWKWAIPIAAATLSLLGLFGYISPEVSIAGCLCILAGFLYHNRRILHLL